MKINPKSASTLVWAAAIFMLLGLVVLSPTGQFMFFVIAVLFTLAPALFGQKVWRIVGCAMLAFSVTLAYLVYPAFEKDYGGYRKRAQTQESRVQ